MFVAITGNIGSGKTFVSIYIRSLGYEVLDLDEMTKLAYLDPQVKSKLNDAFSCIVDGEVDKKILKAKLIDENINILNSIIHPFILERIKPYMHSDKLVFCEVPLLFETDFYKYFDKSIAIIIDDKLRNERLYSRDPKNYESMKNMEKYHFTNEIFKQRADFLLINDGNDDKLFMQINNIIDLLTKLK